MEIFKIDYLILKKSDAVRNYYGISFNAVSIILSILTSVNPLIKIKFFLLV